MKLTELTPLLETPISNAYEKLLSKKLREKGFRIWATPAGSASRWPDIGASTTVDRTTYNLHIEVKTKKTDPMGSFRSWEFKKGKFSRVEGTEGDEYTELMFDIINGDPTAIERADNIRKEMQRFFGGRFPALSTGMLRPLFKQGTSKKEMEKKVNEYREKHSYQIKTPNEVDPRVGQMIQDHYRGKYKKRRGQNLILLAVGDEVFRVKHPDAAEGEHLQVIYNKLGVKDIPELPTTFDGVLECRIGPRPYGKVEMFLTLKATGLKKLKGAKLP